VFFSALFLPILYKTFTGRESGFPGYLVVAKEMWVQNILKVLYLFETNGDLRIDDGINDKRAGAAQAHKRIV
jgi:hypothetical protein